MERRKSATFKPSSEKTDSMKIKSDPVEVVSNAKFTYF